MGARLSSQGPENRTDPRKRDRLAGGKKKKETHTVHTDACLANTEPPATGHYFC